MKIPTMTKMKVKNTNTKKIKLVSVKMTLYTSLGATPKNPKIGLFVDPKAKNPKMTAMNKNKQQPNAPKHPSKNFLPDAGVVVGAVAVGFVACVTGAAVGVAGFAVVAV